MSRHSNGKMNWELSDTTKDLIRMRLVWGGVGVIVGLLMIAIALIF